MGDVFRRSNDSVASIGANVLTCVLDVSYDENADVITSDCDDANGEAVEITGKIIRRGTMTAEVKDDDETQLGYIDVGTSGAWIDQPAGTTAGDIQWTATSAEVHSRRFVSSRGDKATYEVGLLFTGLDHSAISA